MDNIEDDLFLALGRYVYLWASLENSINNLIAILMVVYTENNLETEIPRTLKRKVSFIKQAAKKAEKLKSCEKGLLKYADRINNLKEIRHTLIHGIPHTNLSKEKIEKKDSLKLTRLIEKNGKTSVISYKTTTNKLTKSCLDVSKLTAEISLLNYKIIKMIKSPELNEGQIQKLILRCLPNLQATE